MNIQNLAALNSFSEIGYNQGEIAMGAGLCVEPGNHTIEVFDSNVSSDCPIEIIEILAAPECVEIEFDTTFETVIVTESTGELCFVGLAPELGSNIDYTIALEDASGTSTFGTWIYDDVTGCIEYTAGTVSYTHLTLPTIA